MSVEQFNQLAQMFFPKSRYVSLSFGTEPLMSKDFNLFIAELGKHDVPNTHFITNGLLLTEEVITASILSGINCITISNDAATAETYKRIRGGDFATVISKLKLIHELKEEYKSTRPAVRIQFTLFRYNRTEVIPFIDEYHPYFQEFCLSHLSPKYHDSYLDPILDRLGKEEFIEIRTNTIRAATRHNLAVKITFNDYDRQSLLGKWCTIPLASRFIYYSGDLMMCDKQVYGNIFREDLSTIDKRIDEAFQEYNPNCKIDCTQPIAKVKGLDFRPRQAS